MNINDRITVDDNELFQFLDEKLDKLQQFRYDGKYRALLGDEIIDKLTVWEKNIKKQKDVPLTLVVCGEFKRGKSSLINALLGEDIATTNVTTETITVNRISYGEHENEIVLKGGKRITLTDEELKCENLEGILAQIPENDKVTVLELKRPIEALKDITIIDTPGLGDSIKDFNEEVEYALKQADAVVYVFSVAYPLSMQEQFFIKTAIKPQKYTDLFLVANSCDILEEVSDLDRMKKVASDRIGNILPDEEPLMLSALDERSAQLGKSAPNEELSPVLAENFAKFRAELDHLLVAKRHMVIPDRIQRMMNAMMADIQTDIDAINVGLSEGFEDLQEKRAEIDDTKKKHSEQYSALVDQIDGKLEIYKSNAGRWITDFVTLMERDVDSLVMFSTDDIKKYYSVFCVDALQNAIERCNEYFMESVYSEVENVSADVAKKLSMKGADSSTAFTFSLNTHAWTKGDNVEYANNALGFSNIIVTFIAATMRDHEIKKNAPDLIKNIKEQYPGLKASILPAITKSYSEIAQSAKKQLVEYFSGKKNELDAQLEKAESVAHQDENKKLEIKEAVNTVERILDEIKKELVF